MLRNKKNPDMFSLNAIDAIAVNTNIKKNNRQKTETETETRWDPFGEREIPQFSENEKKKYKV